MRQVNITKTLAAADADGICLSQTPAGAGNLTIAGALASGGVATMDSSRRALITCAGADAGKSFTIYGKIGGVSIEETLAGSNGSTSQSLRDYDSVSRIAVSAALAGAVTVGTSGVGSTPWIALDQYVPPNQSSLALEITGTLDVTVQTTDGLILDQTWMLTNVPVPFDHPVLVGITASQLGELTTVVAGVRATINSGTGTVTFRVRQSGIRS